MTPTTPQTQLDKIKTDLLTGQPVDSVTAFNRHYITRLSAIIHRLRNRGYPIIATRQEHNGLAVYRLPDGWQPCEPTKPSDIKKPVKSTTI